MAKKQKKSKVNEDKATRSWMETTLQDVHDALVGQLKQPLVDDTVLMSRVVAGAASGLLMGTHHKGKVDGAIFIHYSRLLPVVHGFRRVLHNWPEIFPPEVLDGVPDGKLPPQPGEEENPEGVKPTPGPDEPDFSAIKEVVVALPEPVSA
jgi:hypothetical protein